MYNTNVDPHNLRQGDVISSVLLPRFAIDPIECIYRRKGGDENEFVNKTIVATELRFAVVISQCCEFNVGKRKSFSLAEMIPCRKWRRKKETVISLLAELIPFSRSPFKSRPFLGDSEDVATLMAENTIVPGGKNSSVHAYCYEADKQHLMEPYVVDFTRITSVGMGDAKCLLKQKILQLTDDERRKFQLKLGYFFSRRG